MGIALRSYGALLAAYLWPQRWQVTVLATLLLGNVGLQLVNPLIVRRFIDAATAAGALSTLSGLALLFLGLAVLSQVTSVLETYVAESVGWAATNRLRSDLAAHLLGLDMTFHHAHLPGELLQRVDGDVGLLTNFFSRFTISVLASLLLLLGALIVLLGIDWRLSLVFAAFAVVGIVVLHRVREVPLPYQRASRQSFANLYGYLGEWLAGTEDIRSRGATGYVLLGFYQQLQERLRASRAVTTVTVLALWGPMWLLAALGTALAYGIGAALFRAGAISTGTVYLLVSYAAVISQPLLRLSSQLQDFQQATVGISRVRELLALRSALPDGRGEPLPGGPLAVDFAGVGFGYGDGSAVLHDVSFGLPPGAVLGVLGRTGSGKTTLTRLLLRLYDPSAGAIRLGGVDLRDTRQHVVRQRVAMVTQDVQLFHASIRDNLTFFDRAITDARLVQALGELGLGDWYAALPHGLDTELTGGGSDLSAGQAQLLAFARVFLRDPGLVILDEASSRLDPATERLIEHAIDRLLLGRTAIIVAHRLATVQRADTVLILDGGRITEYGDREALAQDPSSRFAALQRTGLEVAFA